MSNSFSLKFKIYSSWKVPPTKKEVVHWLHIPLPPNDWVNFKIILIPPQIWHFRLPHHLWQFNNLLNSAHFLVSKKRAKLVLVMMPHFLPPWWFHSVHTKSRKVNLSTLSKCRPERRWRRRRRWCLARCTKRRRLDLTSRADQQFVVVSSGGIWRTGWLAEDFALTQNLHFSFDSSWRRADDVWHS